MVIVWFCNLCFIVELSATCRCKDLRRRQDEDDADEDDKWIQINNESLEGRAKERCRGKVKTYKNLFIKNVVHFAVLLYIFFQTNCRFINPFFI